MRRSDRGAAAVEFALVLPFLLLLICGVVDFGRAYNAQITVTHAARESVRALALQKDHEAAAKRAAPLLDVTIVDLQACPNEAGLATLTVVADFGFITPLITKLAPGLTRLTSEGVMRCGG